MADLVLPTVEQKTEEMLESICDLCVHLYVDNRDDLSDYCKQCEECQIERKLNELVALIQARDAVEFAEMVDRAYKEAYGEEERSLAQ